MAGQKVKRAPRCALIAAYIYFTRTDNRKHVCGAHAHEHVPRERSPVVVLCCIVWRVGWLMTPPAAVFFACPLTAGRDVGPRDAVMDRGGSVWRPHLANLTYAPTTSVSWREMRYRQELLVRDVSSNHANRVPSDNTRAARNATFVNMLRASHRID